VIVVIITIAFAWQYRPPRDVEDADRTE